MTYMSVRLKTLSIYFIYCLLGVVGVLSMFSPMIFSRFTMVQPGPGDAIFNAIILEHVYKSFFSSHYAGNFYSPIFFYPRQLTLTYSDNLLGSAPIYWLLRIFFGQFLSFGLWEIIVCVLTFAAFVYFLRYLKVDPIVAGVLSFIFTFGAPRAESTAHVQIFAQFYTPLFFLFLYRLLKSPTLKDFNIAMLLLFLQTLAGYYLGWFLIFSLCILLFAYVLCARDELLRLVVFVKLYKIKLIKHTILWAFVFLLFWAPYISTSMFFRYRWDINWMIRRLPTLQMYTDFPPGGLYAKIFNIPLIRESHEIGLGYGSFLSLGLFGLLVAYTGIKLFSRKLKVDFSLKFARALYLTAIIITLLSIKIFNFSFWTLIYSAIPGADGVRYVYRIWLITYFYLFTAVGIYWKYFSFSNKWYVYPLLTFFVVEQLVFYQKSFVFSYFSNIEGLISQKVTSSNCGLFYVRTFYNEEPKTIVYTISAMWAAIETNIPTINGYSGIELYDFQKPLELADIAKTLDGKYKGTFCYLTVTNAAGDLSVSKYVFPFK